MKILLVNVDAHWNFAIRKMYNFYKNDNDVEMVDLKFRGYPSKKTKTIDASGFDKVFVSNIFDINKDKVTVTGCSDVTFGGVGSRNPELKLPEEIDKTEPFYFPDEDTSYGFITRGCIRNCWFCKVPKYEGKMREYCHIESIVKHKKVVFMDANILAYDKHMEVLNWCLNHPDVKVDFNQGLDFRLVNDENLKALSKLNYMRPYKFAFDEPKYQPLLEEKLALIKKYIKRKWDVMFYIYYHPDMELKQLVERVQFCRKNWCLPYVMRDIACWDCEHKNFLIDYASYCNQPAMFKKCSFANFLGIRYTNQERIDKSLQTYEEIMSLIDKE